MVQRQLAAEAVLAAQRAHAGAVSPVITERLAPFLPEAATMPDFELVLQLIGSLLGWSSDRLMTLDKAQIDELANDVEARLARDDAAAEVREILVMGRQTSLGLFGPPRTVQIFPIRGATAEQPDVLWRQAEHTLSRLRDPDFVLPVRTTGSIQFDPAEYAAELEPATTRLRDALEAVKLNQRQAEWTVGLKSEGMEEHDQVFRGCTRILSGFFVLGGRRDLAERVRPSVRRRRQPEETAPPADGEPGDGVSGDSQPLSESAESAEPAPSPA
jgi:hypothetical protein